MNQKPSTRLAVWPNFSKPLQLNTREAQAISIEFTITIFESRYLPSLPPQLTTKSSGSLLSARLAKQLIYLLTMPLLRLRRYVPGSGYHLSQKFKLFSDTSVSLDIPTWSDFISRHTCDVAPFLVRLPPLPDISMLFSDTSVSLPSHQEVTSGLFFLAMSFLSRAELTPLPDISDTSVSLDVPSRGDFGSLLAWNIFVLDLNRVISTL